LLIAENYVHRCGRTGRGNNKGQALSFCSPDETALLEEIETYTGETILRYEISNSEYLNILDDTDDGSNDWKSLIKKANEDLGTDDVW